MKLVKKILSKLTGLHYPQEYLCFSRESFEQPLHVYTIIEDIIIEDITNLHSFVGYSPVIIAFSHSAAGFLHPEQIRIAFTAKLLQSNEKFRSKDAVAILLLGKINMQEAGDETILFYGSRKGEHYFISSFHQFMIGLYNRLYHKKAGNVYLPGNLYKQVQIAYSVPRNISLITVGGAGLFNLFPTDLHGPVNEDLYIISLRHEGKAARQVMNTGKILLTQIHSDLYKTVYALGKNHMQEMKGKENFPFSGDISANFQLPLPPSALSYRELILQDSFIHGIHRLMLFKTLNRQAFRADPSTLSHIHNVCATWRQNKGLAGNYLLR